METLELICGVCLCVPYITMGDVGWLSVAPQAVKPRLLLLLLQLQRLDF